MTEKAESMSRNSSASDESLVLVQSEEVISQQVCGPEEIPCVVGTFSNDSQENEDTPILTTDARVIDDSQEPSAAESLCIEEGNQGEDDDDEEDEVTRERKVGAGIAIGIMTAPLCGPVLAVVAGVAAAYGTSQEGVAGDACRAAGDIAIVAKEKAIEVDKKHDIVNKTKSGANQLLDKARDANERHEILEKMKKVVICTLKNVAAALQLAADKLKESRDKRKAARQAARQARAFPDDKTELDGSFSYEKVDTEKN